MEADFLSVATCLAGGMKLPEVKKLNDLEEKT